MQAAGHSLAPLGAFVLTLAAATYLAGCAHAPDRIEVRETANAARNGVAAVVHALRALDPTVIAVCANAMDGAEARACGAANAALRYGQHMTDAAYLAIDTYDRLGVGMAAMNRAVDAAREARASAEAAVDALRGVP